jgi:hypothetical protein
MSGRIYIRVTMNKDTASRELIADQMKIADLSYQDVTNAIIEVTSILRHGRGNVSLRVADKVIEMSFADALNFVMQAASSLRW